MFELHLQNFGFTKAHVYYIFGEQDQHPISACEWLKCHFS